MYILDYDLHIMYIKYLICSTVLLNCLISSYRYTQCIRISITLKYVLHFSIISSLIKLNNKHTIDVLRLLYSK